MRFIYLLGSGNVVLIIQPAQEWRCWTFSWLAWRRICCSREVCSAWSAGDRAREGEICRSKDCFSFPNFDNSSSRYLCLSRACETYSFKTSVFNGLMTPGHLESQWHWPAPVWRALSPPAANKVLLCSFGVRCFVWQKKATAWNFHMLSVQCVQGTSFRSEACS